MQFAELKNRLLTTRDLRQNRLDDIIRVTDNTLLQLALNIPGEQKCPPGVDCLMQWANEQLRASFNIFFSFMRRRILLGHGRST